MSEEISSRVIDFYSENLRLWIAKEIDFCLLEPEIRHTEVNKIQWSISFGSEWRNDDFAWAVQKEIMHDVRIYFRSVSALSSVSLQVVRLFIVRVWFVSKHIDMGLPRFASLVQFIWHFVVAAVLVQSQHCSSSYLIEVNCIFEGQFYHCQSITCFHFSVQILIAKNSWKRFACFSVLSISASR